MIWRSRKLSVCGLKYFQKKSKTFYIGNIYRNPNEAVIWNEIFENHLENVLKEQKELYLLGDLNRDLLNLQTKTAWLGIVCEVYVHYKYYNEPQEPREGQGKKKEKGHKATKTQ